MAIKLIKACKELNIGISTLIDFCESIGHPVEADPSIRIDDDLYLLLAKNFNKDVAIKLEAERQHTEMPGEDTERAQREAAYARWKERIERREAERRAEELESSEVEESMESPEIFKLRKVELGGSPKVIGKIDLSSSGDSSRFPHPGKFKGGSRAKLNPHIEEKLESIPWSCGIVSIFNGREYGIIKAQDESESFFHPNNCDDENIADKEFVFFKSLFNPAKERYTAYHIHRAKEDDGYQAICDFLFSKNIVMDQYAIVRFRAAMSAYAQKYWVPEMDYCKAISDLKPYLITSSSDQVLLSRCRAILFLFTSDYTIPRDIPEDFFKLITEIIFPELSKECLLETFLTFRSGPLKDYVFKNLGLLPQEQQEYFVRFCFPWDCISAAKWLMEMENEGLLDKALSRKCFNEKFNSIREDQKAQLYFMGFDIGLRDSISDSTFKQYLIINEKDNICNIYKAGLVSQDVIVSACCGILRNAAGMKSKVDAFIELWSHEMPELIDKIKEQLHTKIDEKYLYLWKDGIVDAPSNETWLKMIREDEDALGQLYQSYRDNLISLEIAEQILQLWYKESLLKIENTSKERFAHDQLVQDKFRRKGIDTNLLIQCDEYFPIIRWYDSIRNGLSKPKDVDFSQLSKYFFLFSEEEQIRIVKYLFRLQTEEGFELQLSDLQLLTTKSQRKTNGDDSIHVCFSIDLVIEALLKFKARQEFLTEKEIVVLALATQDNVDFRSYNTRLIHEFFDLCKGLEWRKYVDGFDKYGHRLKEKEVLSKNCGRKPGVIFCEGREMVKKDEMGKTRHLCRNSYCYGAQVRTHSNWESYTLYDFCRMLNFDLKDKDRAGYYCDEGKYLKFMALLNRFIQFAEHLYCRECGRLRKPSEGLTALAVSVSTNFECYTSGCPEYGKPYYLSHCLNPDCAGPIDGRDSKQCPNNWLICPQCGSCCSTNVFERQYNRYVENGYQVSDWLRRAVENKIGHAEKNMHFCYKCGSLLESCLDRSDIDHICPNCGKEYKIDDFYRPRYFSNIN